MVPTVYVIQCPAVSKKYSGTDKATCAQEKTGNRRRPGRGSNEGVIWGSLYMNHK